uniref:ShKT domain-containing protein n=1 Tax=Haemonchus contortus TaxID=6289 RepID=A0A7I4YUE8_HAECO
MTSVSLLIFLIVMVASNINATATEREGLNGTVSQARGRETQNETEPAVKNTNKCEDRPECPAHIANGFCYREGITYEQKKTYCPRGCRLCDE